MDGEGIIKDEYGEIIAVANTIVVNISNRFQKVAELFQELDVPGEHKEAIGNPYDWWCSHHKHPKERFRIHKIINIVSRMRQKIINSWHYILEEITKEGDELDAVGKRYRRIAASGTCRRK